MERGGKGNEVLSHNIMDNDNQKDALHHEEENTLHDNNQNDNNMSMDNNDEEINDIYMSPSL